MAKRSMVEREKRRIQLSKKLYNKRASLRNIIKSHEASMEEKLAASEKLQRTYGSNIRFITLSFDGIIKKTIS